MCAEWRASNFWFVLCTLRTRTCTISSSSFKSSGCHRNSACRLPLHRLPQVTSFTKMLDSVYVSTDRGSRPGCRSLSRWHMTDRTSVHTNMPHLPTVITHTCVAKRACPNLLYSDMSGEGVPAVTGVC